MKHALPIVALLAAGCTASYQQSPLTEPTTKLNSSGAVQISTPEDGWYGEKEYKNSGKMTATAVKRAFDSHATRADITASCNSAGRPTYCDGEVVRTGPDCEQFGLDCAAGFCVGTGEACQQQNDDWQDRVYFEGLSCTGDVLEGCVQGQTHNRDCSNIGPGWSCQTVGDYHFCGLASECEPGNIEPGTRGTAERCEGTEVVFCNAGRIERMDCTELGFSGCDVDTAYGCVPMLSAG